MRPQVIWIWTAAAIEKTFQLDALLESDINCEYRKISNSHLQLSSCAGSNALILPSYASESVLKMAKNPEKVVSVKQSSHDVIAQCGSFGAWLVSRWIPISKHTLRPPNMRSSKQVIFSRTFAIKTVERFRRHSEPASSTLMDLIEV